MFLSDEQEHAFGIFKEGRNLLVVAGPGGVGKTHSAKVRRTSWEQVREVHFCALGGEFWSSVDAVWAHFRNLCIQNEDR